MMENEINIEQKYIKNVDNLVPRPDLAFDVLSMAHNANCNFNELSQKIELDPNLTANMLRLANSAYFGHMRAITSVKDIIVRLGLETVKLLAITSASVGLMKSPQEAYNLEPGSLWYHSHASAVLASVICQYAKIDDSGSVYTASLLHDIGKVLLNKPLQVAISNIKIKPEKKFSSLVELENSLLQTDHAKVGEALLEKWGLPEHISQPVGDHHSPEKLESADIGSKIVYLANFLVESIGIRSMAPENYTFNIQEFIDQNQILPDIPNFQENMEGIMEEFFTQFNETTNIG
jgi:putative nucleotidyltransferase with HDIG domain